MKKLIGSEVEIYLKESSGQCDLHGILVEIDAEAMYLKSCDASKIYGIFVVPRDNISYCAVKTLAVSKAIEPKKELAREERPVAEMEIEPQQMPTAQSLFLDVIVNDNRVAHIPVPPTFNFNKWSDNIRKIAYGNPDVRFCLENKKIMAMDYAPGELYIEVIDADMQISNTESEEIEVPNDSSFSMSMNDNAASQFLPGTKMVEKLNSFVKKGDKKND